MKSPVILFNADAEVGAGVNGAAEFPDCDALLRHMDRLGITRSMVWSRQARDHHPATGNRRLLEELAERDPARERLVPALVIAPTMQYEPKSVDELEEQLRSGSARALRLCPAQLRFKLHQLDPILDRVKKHRPVLFVAVGDVPDDRDLVSLARRHAELPLVVLHGMWPQVFNYSLLDVARQCPNVIVELSQFHTLNTTQWFVERCGAERVVFGFRYKAHNGAALAGLQHAAIPEAARALVASGNLEKMLGLGPTAAPPARPADPSKTLWARFRAGAPPGVPILDAHAHLGAEGIWPQAEREVPAQAAAGLPVLKALGVETLFVSGTEALFSDPVAGNRALEADLAPFGERYRGWAVFNPFYGPALEAQFDGYFSRPFFAGFKTLCDYWGVPVTDPRFRPMYAYAHRRRLPILLHTWEGPNDSPALLKEVAAEFSGATFLLGHSGGGTRGRQEAVALAKERPNVMLEFCGSFCTPTPWEETLPAVGRDRVVFGSDGLMHDPAWELGRYLSIDLPDSELLPGLGDNLRRVLSRRV
jgi:predicted TIM-barrel fold metal-dependent hydrolase